MITHELLDKDPYIVIEEAYLIILEIKSDVCAANNGKDTKHTRKISRRVHFVSNGENCKVHNIIWCSGGKKFADIATKNLWENNLNIIIKYIIVIHEK